MAGERLSMRKIREVLRLRQAHGLSQRAIGNSLRLSTGAVNMCLGRARRAGLGWPTKVADLVMIPCRPGILDLETLRTTTELLQGRAKRPPLVVLNTVPASGTRQEQAIQAIQAMGLAISPVLVGHRVAFEYAVQAGLSVSEYEPGGKAAAKMKRPNLAAGDSFEKAHDLIGTQHHRQLLRFCLSGTGNAVHRRSGSAPATISPLQQNEPGRPVRPPDQACQASRQKSDRTWQRHAHTIVGSQAKDCGPSCPRSCGSAADSAQPSAVSRSRVGVKHPNPGRPSTGSLHATVKGSSPPQRVSSIGYVSPGGD